MVHLRALLALLPQFLSQFQNSAEDSDQDICVHASLMSLINNDDGILVQQEISREFTQHDTVRHEFDRSAG